MDITELVKKVYSASPALSDTESERKNHTIAAIPDTFKKNCEKIFEANRENTVKFLQSVDSANNFVNCPAMFTNGFMFGLGAEAGISTNKIHAREPVGLEGLRINKWMHVGNGRAIADYASGKKHFTHKPLDGKFEKTEELS